MTPREQKIIDEIIIEIESGKSYTEIVSVICGKFRFSDRTFDKWWKLANEAYNVILDTRRAITESKTTQAHIEAVEIAIFGRAEKLEILRKIAVGEDYEKYFILNGKPQRTISKPDIIERMKAIEIHNKMQGDNAPDETKLTMVEQPLFPDVQK